MDKQYTSFGNGISGPRSPTRSPPPSAGGDHPSTTSRCGCGRRSEGGREAALSLGPDSFRNEFRGVTGEIDSFRTSFGSCPARSTVPERVLGAQPGGIVIDSFQNEPSGRDRRDDPFRNEFLAQPGEIDLFRNERPGRSPARRLVPNESGAARRDRLVPAGHVCREPLRAGRGSGRSRHRGAMMCAEIVNSSTVAAQRAAIRWPAWATVSRPPTTTWACTNGSPSSRTSCRRARHPVASKSTRS